MPFPKPFLRLFVVSLLLGCTSCVKDVDLDQDDNFLVEPSISIDLVDFTFDSDFFIDTEDNMVTERSDVLELQLLDQDLVNELDSVNFYFRIENTFQHDFENVYGFYPEGADDPEQAENMEPLYEIQLAIDAESTENSGLDEKMVTVKNPDLERLKEAANLLIELRMLASPGASLDGELKVDVTAVYNFSEREL